ncbi:MAG: molybdenum cofactor biosynthesis protein MoaE [Chloroflexota bacterium]|nr:molybdenum cofactor biosynthesis protein MoaE [Chloroflexota bacterium]
MRVTIRLFAMLRERAGWRQRELELPDGASVEQAWQAVAGDAPGLESYRSAVRFARNGRYAASDDRLSDGDELALIPPVAGGRAEGDRLVRCELRGGPINDDLLAELRHTVPTPADGALVVFVGQTRETAGTPAPGQEAEAALFAGKRVTGLEYEAFEEMAAAVLHEIAAEIEQRFGVRRLAIVHRSGHVPLGEPSVVIAVAAAHRGPAFDAARYAIEELKARAPIWKRELYADGSVWIGSPARESAAGLDQRAQ